MASKWPIMTLREARVTLIDCDHRTPPAATAGYPYVAIPQLQAGRVKLSDARRITREHLLEWTRKAKPAANDVILSRRCNPGETAVVPLNLDFALGQNLVLLRADGSKTYPPFLRWLVRGPEWWDQIGKFLNVGAVFDSLKCADIPSFELHIPSIPEQRAISHVLSALDDKIELNRRTNETLEARARAIFKSWFVDFDPVKAKAAGRKPAGMDDATAALFPNSLQKSILGDVPKEWGAQPFSDTVKIVGGGTPKTSVPEYWGGDIPWFSVVDAPSVADVWVVDTEKNITSEGVENSSAQILPIGTTIISARGTVGRVALVGVPMAMNQSCYGLQGKADKCGTYTYFATRELVARLQQHAHGSVFDTITRDTLSGVSIAVPPVELIRTFEAHVGQTMERIRAALFESRTLAALRDMLLPKLLSGEIRLQMKQFELHAHG